MSQDPSLSEMMRPHLVCLCNHVSERDLRDEIKKGARTFQELQERTLCSTKCGNCSSRVQEILKKSL